LRRRDEKFQIYIYQGKDSHSLPCPLKCPHCGFEKIYKNGTYKIKPERFFEQLKKDKETEIIVQQFICPYCRNSVYTPEKKRKIILF